MSDNEDVYHSDHVEFDEEIDEDLAFNSNDEELYADAFDSSKVEEMHQSPSNQDHEAMLRAVDDVYAKERLALEIQKGKQLSILDLADGNVMTERTLSISDLLDDEASGQAPTESALLHAPLEEAHASKSLRIETFESNRELLNEWNGVVAENRRKPHLDFSRPEGPRGATSLNELTDRLSSEGGLENDLSKLRDMFQSKVEESMEDPDEPSKIAELKSKLFDQQIKAKHIRKIKSRSYRKRHAKRKPEGPYQDDEESLANDRFELPARKSAKYLRQSNRIFVNRGTTGQQKSRSVQSHMNAIQNKRGIIEAALLVTDNCEGVPNESQGPSLTFLDKPLALKVTRQPIQLSSQHSLAATAGPNQASQNDNRFTFVEETQKNEQVDSNEIGLQGWGSWGGEGIKKRTRQRDMKEAAWAVKPKPKRAVKVSTKVDRKVSKYQTSTVPHPFTNAKSFNRRLDTPVGDEWNAYKTHDAMAKPALITKHGVLIEPISAPKKVNRMKRRSTPPQRRGGISRMRRTAREAPFSGMHDYVARKRRKIDDQGLASVSKVSSLFSGLLIWVDGYTDPPLAVLRPMILQHGGKVTLTPRSGITHIIASHAPPSRNPRPGTVVTPEWILSCITENRLLSTRLFGLKHPESSSSSFSASSFFKKSRLHLIGSWKAYFRQHITEWKQDIEPRYANPVDSNTCFFHVDMDCFFASVAMASDPSLFDIPIAVAHTSGGNSEISSANYPARKFGVKVGMFVNSGMKHCPQLKVVPYNFEAYEKLAVLISKVLLSYTHAIECGSIDEACLQFPTMDHSASIALANDIRRNIFEITQCTASIGIGFSRIASRLATRRAKPNGIFVVTTATLAEILDEIPVDFIPGIGRKTKLLLEEHSITTCKQLQQSSLDSLIELCGDKKGLYIYRACRGEDLPSDSNGLADPKSINVDMNWGVRLQDKEQLSQLLGDLCEELSSRVQRESMFIQSLAVNLKIAMNPSIEPKKFMGHGACKNVRKTYTFSSALNDAASFQRVALNLSSAITKDIVAIRGIGLSASMLQKRKGLPQSPRQDIGFFFKQQKQKNGKKDQKTQSVSEFIQIDHIDMDVVRELPLHIQKEVKREFAARGIRTIEHAAQPPIAVDALFSAWHNARKQQRLHPDAVDEQVRLQRSADAVLARDGSAFF